MVKRSEKQLCIMIIVCILFGNTIKFGHLRLAGMTLTLYRVGISLLSIYCVIMNYRRKNSEYHCNKAFFLYSNIVFFWIIYGAFSMIVSPYASLNDGIKQLLNLLLGVLSVYCIIFCCDRKETLDYFIKTLRIVICILCLFGVFEIIFGYHLYTSEQASFLDESFFQSIKKGWSSLTIFSSTAIFYGVNDFASFLAIFFPLFFSDRKSRRGRKLSNIIMMMTIIFILFTSDANIAFVAILSSLFLAVLFKGMWRTITPCCMGIFAMRKWITQWLTATIITVKNICTVPSLDVPASIGTATNLDVPASIGTVTNFVNLEETLMVQIQTSKMGYGSLYSRITLMRDALQMGIDSYLFGIGPDAFSRYLNEHGSQSGLVDPHNLWFEIFSEYGIWIFGLFSGMILYLFVLNFKKYLIYRELIILQFLCMLISYVFASIAPSSFLDYGYQWIVIAIGIASIKVFNRESRKE